MKPTDEIRNLIKDLKMENGIRCALLNELDRIDTYYGCNSSALEERDKRWCAALLGILTVEQLHAILARFSAGPDR